MNRIPEQQPAWISAATVQSQERVASFVRSVYAWMFGGLLATTIASLFVVNSPAMQALVLGSRIVPFGLFFIELGIVFYLSARITHMSPRSAAIAFLAFSLLNGLSLSAIFFLYSKQSIAAAFISAGGMFGAMALYGLVTKRDLTSWGSFFMMGLFGIIICSIVNWFLKSPGLSFTISILGVFIFLGLTAYDNQKLKAWAVATGPELRDNFAVLGALNLYLDFINLFLFLLRLFGRRD